MKKLSSYSKRLVLKKLSSMSVLIILSANVLLPILSLLVGSRIASIQIKKGQVAEITGYYPKVTILCLLLSALIIVVLDVVFIINPLLSLENVLDQYGKLTRAEDIDQYNKYVIASSLETMFLDMINNQKQTIARQYEAEMLRQETELRALQSQINPHFLYNTLDSIRGLALIKDVPEIADMTEALSKLFRNLTVKDRKMITLREECENIKNYIIIQQFRFSNKFQYRCEIPDETLNNYFIFNLMLQPIVENAIVHGLEQKREGGEIVVKGYTTEKRLVLSVQDNGVGLSSEELLYLNRILNTGNTKKTGEKQRKQMGIAMININKRIKLKFGDMYGVSIMSTKDVYTKVEIVLPLMVSGGTNEERDPKN